MVRNRVLSFMSAFNKSSQTLSLSGPANATSQDLALHASSKNAAVSTNDSRPPTRSHTERSSSRPMSMVQTYQPALMEIEQDTVPELQPIFTFLNSHANKLYQEGYFLKLNDLDSQGRPNVDRSWTESFAQLVGTVLSLWDAVALDAAGQDGEVAPTFINLADASIKMIESLPTKSAEVDPLQNVLSISTAGKNRYLLHFNTSGSLIQWTAAIRLAMYENATLQEAYTGSLIAGKGRTLNNIKSIMERTRIKSEDWTRVRFGAGTPWRRCWCIITPPDEKEIARHQKQAKKRSAYERPAPLKGKIQFFDTKKTKKVVPIATINDAYSAYAIYPQSKSLIDQSTLIKVEGSITIHANPPVTTEGFVFVMPEVHPAVSGFEMMLRYLFPLYDVYALYGRPLRLAADTHDPRSLMFALPQERRYGYLEILDVASLVHEKGSTAWSEREWRKRMKELTSNRMSRMTNDGRPRSRASSYRDYRNSLPGGRTLRHDDRMSNKSSTSLNFEAPPMPPPHQANIGLSSDVAPNELSNMSRRPKANHMRSFSEAIPGSKTKLEERMPQDTRLQPASRTSFEQRNMRPLSQVEPSPDQSESGGPPSIEPGSTPHTPSETIPLPPPHGPPLSIAAHRVQMQQHHVNNLEGNRERTSSEGEAQPQNAPSISPSDLKQNMQPVPPPAQVATPPAFSHEPGAKPKKRPGITPDMQRAHSRLSITTLQQLTDAGRHSMTKRPDDDNLPTASSAAAAAAAAWKSNNDGAQRREMTTERAQSHDRNEDGGNGRVIETAVGVTPSPAVPAERSEDTPRSLHTARQMTPPPYYQDKPLLSSYNLLSPQTSLRQDISPSSAESSINETYELSRPAKVGETPPLQMLEPSIIEDASSKPVAVDTRPASARISSDQSIKRKPVPRRLVSGLSNVSDGMAPVRSTSSRSESGESELSMARLQSQYVDEGALSKVLELNRLQSLTSKASSRDNDAGSLYENASTESPDYASTRKSEDTERTRHSIEKPRQGVLKIVGQVEPEIPKDIQIGDANYRHSVTPEPQISAAIPMVDFGPTHAHSPGTLATSVSPQKHIMQGLTGSHEKTPRTSRIYENSPEQALPPQASPPPLRARNSPVNHSGMRRSTTSPDMMNTNSSRSPSNRDHRNSMLWQPGAQIGHARSSSRQSITAEQFVQQRAAASRVPTPVYAYAHDRPASSTPPIEKSSRQWSAEHSYQDSTNPQLLPRQSQNKLQKRQSSYTRDVPRLQSQTSTNLLKGSDDFTNYLSAREQEHVARATGSTLVQGGTRLKKNPSTSGSGLVGAIEAREKEKRAMKDGLSGQMVNHAIAQRRSMSQQQQLPIHQPGQPHQYHQMPFMSDQHQQQHQQSQLQLPGQIPPHAMSNTFATSPAYWNPAHQSGAPSHSYYQPQSDAPRSWSQSPSHPGQTMQSAASTAAFRAHQNQQQMQQMQQMQQTAQNQMGYQYQPQGHYQVPRSASQPQWMPPSRGQYNGPR